MPRRSVWCLMIGIVLAEVGLPQQFVAAATRVDLVIDEPFSDRQLAWPITTGVPFPRGALNSEERVRLIDDQGQEQPLQVQMAAT